MAKKGNALAFTLPFGLVAGILSLEQLAKALFEVLLRQVAPGFQTANSAVEIDLVIAFGKRIDGRLVFAGIGRVCLTQVKAN